MSFVSLVNQSTSDMLGQPFPSKSPPSFILPWDDGQFLCLRKHLCLCFHAHSIPEGLHASVPGQRLGIPVVCISSSVRRIVGLAFPRLTNYHYCAPQLGSCFQKDGEARWGVGATTPDPNSLSPCLPPCSG